MRERALAKGAAERFPENGNVNNKLRNKVTKEIKGVVQTHYRGLIYDDKDKPKKCGRLLTES